MASFRGILNIQSLNEFTPRNGVYRKLERADRLSVRQTGSGTCNMATLCVEANHTWPNSSTGARNIYNRA